MEIYTKPYKTNKTWVVWYHNPSDNNWSLKSYKNIYEFDNLTDYFRFQNSWQDNLPPLKNSMFFLMRKKDEYEYIYPMWEDKNNKPGGCWSFKIDSSIVDSIWETLSLYLIGEIMGSTTENSNKINGISFSPKKGFCIIKIWNTDSKDCENSFLNKELDKYIDLTKSIYKSHLENLSKDNRKKERFKNRKKYWNAKRSSGRFFSKRY